MHGAGFSYGAAGLWADEFVLKQTGRERPLCTFLPHSTDDAPGYCARFHQGVGSLGARTRSLSLFRPETHDFADYLLSSDAIFVGGGNTRSMLALWREWGLDAILRRAYAHGVVLSGMSAGAICWFEQGFSDSTGPGYAPLPGLGLLRGICNPHHADDERGRLFLELAPRHPAALGLPDGALVQFVDGRVEQVLGPAASRVYRGGSLAR